MLGDKWVCIGRFVVDRLITKVTGFTLLVGVICNFIFGVFASRLMVTSLAKWSDKKALYGGDGK